VVPCRCLGVARGSLKVARLWFGGGLLVVHWWFGVARRWSYNDPRWLIGGLGVARWWFDSGSMVVRR